jgi:glutamate N-acetyltransferase/amino-acid N-acetyltransferase
MIPKGFLFSTAEAAIKKPGRKDLALICSETEATVAGMFTTNRVKAAPVQLDMKRIRSGKGQAIIVNSGNANACTGSRGMADALQMTKAVADGLNLKSSLAYVCSTGVIGTPMPMEKIKKKVPELINNLGRSTLEDVASAIMTTDTFPKIAGKRITVDGKTGMLVGICKGAGMICPDMATMLCFILTDMAVERKALRKALHEAVGKSFNRITVDGDMSTNDTVIIMANGMLGNLPVTEKSPAYASFTRALDEITHTLSKMIVQDGEGATKLIEIKVKGAGNETDATAAAFAVANSSLVKTAMYGNDANWGRIMAAIGYSGIAFREQAVDIYFGKVRVVSKGIATNKDREAEKVLRDRHVRIIIDLHAGRASATVLTCDMTEEYIRVNAAYRT